MNTPAREPLHVEPASLALQDTDGSTAGEESRSSTGISPRNQQSEIPLPRQFGKWELGSIGLGISGREGVTPSTEVHPGLDVQFDAFDQVDTLYARLLPTLGKDSSFLSEAIVAKYGAWKEKAGLLQLYRVEIEERRRIETMPEDNSRHRADKRKAKEEFEKKIAGRKKKIKDMLGADSKTDAGGKKKDIPLQELRQELRMESIGEDNFLNLLRVYVGDKPENVQGITGKIENIFDSLKEMQQTSVFLEESEKVMALQAGFDMTDGGTRPIEVGMNLYPQQIDQLAREGVPPQIIQALRDLGQRIHVRDAYGVIDVLATGGVALWEYLALPGGLGGPFAAAAGVGGMLLARMIGRNIRNWYAAFPPDQPEDRTAFTLNFRPIGEELGDSKDPRRQMFRGRADNAANFIGRCDNFRAAFANLTKVHPGEVEGWLGLSSRALGAGAEGMELPHRIMLAKTLDKILSDEFRREAGTGHKELEELTQKEQIELITRAIGIVSRETSSGFFDDIIYNLGKRKALGEVNWAERNNILLQHVQDIRQGKRWYHRKEGVQTLDEAREVREQTQRVRDRQQAVKASYQAGYTAVETKATAIETARAASEQLQFTNGYVVTVRDPITGRPTAYTEREGKISVKQVEKTKKEADLTRLYTEIGVDPATGTVTVDGMYDRYRTTKRALLDAQKQLEVKQRQRDEAARLKTQLENQTSVNAAAVAVQERIINTCNAEMPGLQDAVTVAERAHDPYKKSYEPRQTKIETLETRLEQIPGEIQALQEAVIEREAAVEMAKFEHQAELKRLKQALREFGYTEVEVNALGFVIPTLATIEDKYAIAEREFNKASTEFTEMETRVNQGFAAAISDEDKELMKLIEYLGRRVDATKMNSLLVAIYDGTIPIEDLARVSNDEGYQLLLKKIFGEDALSLGPEGNYLKATKLLSKARLCDQALEVWNIHSRAARTEFFAGDEVGLRLYQDAEHIKRVNKTLTERVNQLESTRPPTPEISQELNRLHSEISTNEANRNGMLSQLYDSRVASLLAQDRVWTAEFIRKTLYKLTEDAQNGFIEVVSTPTGVRTEVSRTTAATLTVTEASIDTQTREVIDRGGLRVETIEGLPGVSVDMRLTRDDPAAGNIDVVVSLDRDHGGVDNLLYNTWVNMPEELLYFYGSLNQQRYGVNLGNLNQEMYGSVPWATRHDAEVAGFTDGALLELFYGLDPTNTKRSLADIRGSTLDMARLPADRGALSPGVKAVLADLLYYYQGDRRRSTVDLNSFNVVIHGVLPPNRGGAIAANYPRALVELFYGPGTNVADPLRSLPDIQGSIIDLSRMPYDGNEVPNTVDAGVIRFFYEVRAGIKRTNEDFDAFIRTLHSDRAAAATAGMHARLIELLYEPGATGRLKDPRNVRIINIPRHPNEITNVAQLVAFIDSSLNFQGLPTNTSELLLAGVTESIALLDPISRIRLVEDKFAALTIDEFTVRLERNGELNVIYENPATHNRHEIALLDFIRKKSYPAEVGAALSGTDKWKRIVTGTGANLIGAVRSTRI